MFEKQVLNYSLAEEVFIGVAIKKLTLFNVYINELAIELDQYAVPGLSLQDKEVKSLFYADDLVFNISY